MITKIEDLDNYLVEAKNHLSREQGRSDKLKEQLESNNSSVIKINLELDLLSKVSILFQKTSEFAREQAKSQIESLVTKCLQFVFDSDIKFLIEIEELRGKANAEFYVVNEVEDILIKTKPELSRGGGVVDIVSLALRIAFLQIHKPRIQGPLILDEPAKHVSEEFVFNVADFLKQTSELFNRQIIMVIYNNHLAAIGINAHKVELKGSISSVMEVTA